MASDALQCRLPVAESFAKDYLEYYRMLPLELTSSGLTVAIHGTPNDDALTDLQEVYGVPLQLEQVDPAILTTAIRQTFARTESVVEFVRDLQGDDSGQPVSPEASILDVRDLANQAPVIRYANLLLREAHQAEASDIHVESGASGMRVRFRRDGVLVDVAAPPPEHQAALVSRLKLLAELDIAQKRVPQDGRFRIRVETRELDIRVSCVPTHTGESIVLRLLDRGGRPVSLDQLGLAPEPLRRFHHLARRPHGILLATGPTGCGKTTTLYAALGLRNASAEKVITVEDPVEYELAGVTQIPVRAHHGVTFASALRSILRQDPDVLFIGEMRDPETAAIAIQAAMTGHLVFSTLHTNDAPSALVRLLDLGMHISASSV